MWVPTVVQLQAMKEASEGFSELLISSTEIGPFICAQLCQHSSLGVKSPERH